MTDAELIQARRTNATIHDIVLNTRALRNRLALKPAPKPNGDAQPETFLNLENLPQPDRDAALQGVRFSPYLASFITQEFLFFNKMIGKPNEVGSLMCNILPTALDALENDPESLKQMYLCYPPAKEVELVTFRFLKDPANSSCATLISNDEGVTMYNFLAAWKRNTSLEMERSAPVCIALPLARTRAPTLTVGHARALEVFKALRGCFVHLHKLPASEIANPEFCGWEQDENLLMDFYKLACVAGEKWFGNVVTRAEQASLVKFMEDEAKAFRTSSQAEIEQYGYTKATWLAISLERKRAKTAATAVFSDSKLVKRIANLTRTKSLFSLWRVNSTTAKLFNEDTDL